MAYYTKLVFKPDVFLAEFNRLLDQCHQETKNKVLTKINGSGLDETWVSPYIQDINERVYDIVTDSIQAFINVYGSGEKANMSSPFWKSYTESPGYNEERGGGNDVFYRPKTYYSYDWENDSRKMVKRKGSGKKGKWKDFPAISGDLTILTRTLQTYFDSFQEAFNEILIPSLSIMFHNGTFITMERVEI